MQVDGEQKRKRREQIKWREIIKSNERDFFLFIFFLVFVVVVVVFIFLLHDI